MKRFKNILIFFDSKTVNQALFDHAVDVPKRNQAALTLGEVIEEEISSLAKGVKRAPAVYLLKGDPGVVITELAQVKAPDLIVMGTVSRAGLDGLLIGKTAEKVLQQVNCSMLTVKSEGFVSPVLQDPA